ncbi:MAG: segregation/condensation protein A [Erysipelotrichaceae bacterium]|nr:segregation/condensation protein A [Erysipelotrichaceae bacterium]MBR2551738.1 segregation/condensation protein A [Erysipelotrichaceae bacterium]MBR4122593.1 segregation/condensation protein A [Erysipelotrichaceae bacterium]
MSFEAKTEQFEGPLDLMLHLISEHKLDIMDLDMEVLADQYLLHLRQMEEHHLEVESDYLVELATLIEYKSRKMLPKRVDQIEEEEDPKDVLVRRLLEYQRYKEASQALYENYRSRQDHFAKPMSDLEEPKDDPGTTKGNAYDLLKAMSKVLRRVQLSRPLETSLTKRELTLEDRRLQILSRLEDLPESFTFETVINDCEDLYECVVSLLAILDLIKDHYLVFTVDESETIHLQKGVNYA